MKEIDLDKFKKYKEIYVDDINKFENINIIDKYVKEWTKDIDNMYFEFLIENGYKIDKPYNIEQLKQIREDLEKQDKFIDTIEWIENKSDKENYIITRHIIPFFNSISNPLSKESKEFILEEWKKKSE